MVSCKRKDGDIVGTWVTHDTSERNSMGKCFAATADVEMCEQVKEELNIREDGTFYSKIIAPPMRSIVDCNYKYRGTWKRDGDLIILSYSLADDYDDPIIHVDSCEIIELADEVLEWKELKEGLEESGGKCLQPVYKRYYH